MINHLEELLEKMNLKAVTLSNYLHVDKSLVSKWINGKRILKSDSTYFNKIIDFFIENDNFGFFESMNVTDINDKIVFIKEYLLCEKKFTTDIKFFQKAKICYCYEKLIADLEKYDYNKLTIYDENYLHYIFKNDLFRKSFAEIIKNCLNKNIKVDIIIPLDNFNPISIEFLLLSYKFILNDNFRLLFCYEKIFSLSTLIKADKNNLIIKKSQDREGLLLSSSCEAIDVLLENIYERTYNIEMVMIPSIATRNTSISLYNNIKDAFIINYDTSLFCFDKDLFLEAIKENDLSESEKDILLDIYEKINKCKVKYIINPIKILETIKQKYISFSDSNYFIFKNITISQNLYKRHLISFFKRYLDNEFEIIPFINPNQFHLEFLNGIFIKNGGTILNDTNNPCKYIITNNIRLSNIFFDLLKKNFTNSNKDIIKDNIINFFKNEGLIQTSDH